jgi:hypothetical protein
MLNLLLSKIKTSFLIIYVTSVFMVNVQLTNTFAVEKIHDVRSSGVGSSDTGCPNGYTVWGTFEDECVGDGTIKETCPSGFNGPDKGECFWVQIDKIIDDAACAKYGKGYTVSITKGYGTFSYDYACHGPTNKEVLCPSGFDYRIPDNASTDKKKCVGPRKF